MKKTKEQKAKDLLVELDAYCTECDATVGASENGAMLVDRCPGCGSKLIKPSLCIWCGNPVNATALYCTGCGIGIVR
jgi:hypothetical protein